MMNKNEFMSIYDTAPKRHRENSVYIWKILINILKHEGSTKNLPADYKSQIMSGKLYNTTSPEDDKMAAKLKALILALDKDENKQKFLKSYFCAALTVLVNGSKDINSDETWTNYMPSRNSHMQGSALNNALISYKDDNSVSLGVDMNKYLDTIIQKKQTGVYEMVDISAEEGDQLIEAVAETVYFMKKSEKFRTNFEKKYQEEENN